MKHSGMAEVINGLLENETQGSMAYAAARVRLTDMKAASKPAKPVRTPKVSENNLKKFSGKYTDWAA